MSNTVTRASVPSTIQALITRSVENGTYDKDMALLGKVRYVVVGVIAAAIFLAWIFS